MNVTASSPSATSGKILLDVRGLAPPEPMQRVLAALAPLPARTTLVVRIHREPVFLFPMIEPDGWSRSSRQLAPDDWEICIWRAEDRP